MEPISPYKRMKGETNPMFIIKLQMIALCLAVSLSAIGCSTMPVPPFALAFDESVSQENVTAVMAAAQTWNERLGIQVFYLEGTDQGQAVDTIAVSITDAHYVSYGKNLVAAAHRDSHRDPWTLSLTARIMWDSTTIEHELGHTLGLQHTDDTESVMYKDVTPWPTTITDKNVQDVRNTWGF